MPPHDGTDMHTNKLDDGGPVFNCKVEAVLPKRAHIKLHCPLNALLVNVRMPQATLWRFFSMMQCSSKDVLPASMQPVHGHPAQHLVSHCDKHFVSHISTKSRQLKWRRH